MSLHKTILDLTTEDWDGFEEIDNCPEGVTSLELSKFSNSFGDQARFLFVPANLVPESSTSKRIVNSGHDLGPRYVVYGGFRCGMGHDPSYG